MKLDTIVAPGRLPRFRRASEPPAFRLTDGDVEIVRLLARHRFMRSTHIAELLGRSPERVNERLKGLYHHAYVDRPRAQLDYYPTSGSSPMVYALADRGARLLIDSDGVAFANVEWSRKNREVGRPFMEHQLEIVDFYVRLQMSARARNDVRLIHPAEMVAAVSDQCFAENMPFALRVKLRARGATHQIGIVPDLVFGLRVAGRAQRNFIVEIDRGTMPVTRSDIRQTSFERKMRVYLAAHAAKLHERQFGWTTFRVLTITTDQYRLHSMMMALSGLRVPHSAGVSLFYFRTRADLCAADPLTSAWCDSDGRIVGLI